MKITTKLKNVAIIGLAALVTVLLPVSSFADKKGSLEISISPIDDKVSLIPGKSYNLSVKAFANQGNVGGFQYKAYVTPYTITDSSYSVVDYNTKGGNNAIVDWITIDQDDQQGIIAPGETKLIKYTIDVPEDAAPGGQYASIMVQENSSQDSQSSGIALGSEYRLAFTIYGSVAGDVDESGKISENNVNSLFLGSNIAGTSLVENTGNIHSNATYVLKVFPLFSDEEVYTNEENPETRMILPNSSRFVSVEWPETPGIGIFNVEQEVKFLDQVSKTSKLVIVIPIWLLLAIVFVIVFWIIWLVMRNKNRKVAAQKSKKSSKSTGTTGSSNSAAKPAATTKPADKPEKSESPTHSEKSE